MTRRILYAMLVTALGLNLILGARIYLANADAAEKDDIYGNLELFTRALERVRRDYVDGEKLTYEDLVHNALQGMLSELDPHSEFMDSSKFSELREDTEGAFGGVGLVLSVRQDTLSVVSPMEDTPAFKAGIRAGDEIIRIEGRSTERMGLPEAVRLMRGEPGTEVELGFRRPSTGEVRDVRLTRAAIKVDSVKDLNNGREFPLIEEGTGYVRITQFGEQTSAELDEALKKLDKRGMRSLILDLRGNPGGLLDVAVKVCEKFLPRNQLIVSTEGRRAEDRAEYRTRSRGRYSDLVVAVLVNIGSASASEIVAGALQDHKRALILGTTSFGKGSVQTVDSLRDGYGLKFTIARYYTPNGRSIQAKGVEPDISIQARKISEGEKDQERQIKEADLKNHLDNDSPQKKESEPKDAPTAPQTKTKQGPLESEQLMSDNQVTSALDILISYDIFKNLKNG
jgi:carboxyl-terminal processing protease